jgi:hypothetical protein
MSDNKNPVSKEFPELLHYTSVSAFTNIYKQQILRATHFEDVNDKSELQRFGIRPFMLRRCATESLRNNEVAQKVIAAGGIHLVVDHETRSRASGSGWSLIS